MKITPRNTHRHVSALRITAPVTRPHPDNPAKQQLLLSYIDSQSRQRSDPTSSKLFLHTGGSNLEGEPATGMDRLMDTLFIIHQDKNGHAIGLDVIPSRLYRSGVVPKSQEGVTKLTVSYEVDGAVARIIRRPPNTRPETCQMVLRALDKCISDGKPIIAGMRLGKVGTVASAGDNIVEVTLSAAAKAGNRRLQSLEEVAESAELEE